MTHGSSFSGIGGFDLAAEWVGWQNIFNCEIDPFCQTVLKHHFPDAEQFTDIRTADFARYKGRIDVFTGGFPCQPFSTAGKQKGTEDDRYLWPEMLGVIRVVRPRWVVGENVYGIVSWSDGLVFEQVCADLEAEGYEVQPYVLPACGVGAPHQRYRTWFVAHRADAGIEDVRERKDEILSGGASADTESQRYESQQARPAKLQSQKRSVLHGGGGDGKVQSWADFQTQSPVCSRDDGLSCGLDGITFSKWRTESIKAYGNAVVPQVVLQIFETINEYEALLMAERSGK